MELFRGYTSIVPRVIAIAVLRVVSPGTDLIIAFTWSGPRGVGVYTEALAVCKAVMPTGRLGSLTPCNLHDCPKCVITLTQPVRSSKQCRQTLAVPPKLHLGLLPFLISLSRLATSSPQSTGRRLEMDGARACDRERSGTANAGGVANFAKPLEILRIDFRR
jgi:hypothetical protein